MAKGAFREREGGEGAARGRVWKILALRGRIMEWQRGHMGREGGRGGSEVQKEADKGFERQKSGQIGVFFVLFYYWK